MSNRNRILSHESAMLPRLPARMGGYFGPMATRLESMNWLQRAIRGLRRKIKGKR